MDEEKITVTWEEIQKHDRPPKSVAGASPPSELSWTARLKRRGPLIPVAILIGLLILGGAPAGAWFLLVKTNAERTKEAILSILKEDRRIGDATLRRLGGDSTPSKVAQAVGDYCAQAEALDMSACPADFRVAYRHYIAACRELQKAIQELPDGFLEAVLMGIINSVLRGERDGGLSRLSDKIEGAVKQVEATWMEVENIGAKYGAAL